MFPASTALRRSLLTSAKSYYTAATAIPATAPATLRQSAAASTSIYRPIITSKFFQTTAKMGKGGVHELQSKQDFENAKAEKGVLHVVDCFATWCGPCKVIAPQVAKLSETYEAAKFYKVDVDEVPDVAQELNIRAMPTFVLLLNGEVIKEVVGANPKALEGAIRDALEGLNEKKET